MALCEIFVKIGQFGQGQCPLYLYSTFTPPPAAQRAVGEKSLHTNNKTQILSLSDTKTKSHTIT